MHFLMPCRTNNSLNPSLMRVMKKGENQDFGLDDWTTKASFKLIQYLYSRRPYAEKWLLSVFNALK